MTDRNMPPAVPLTHDPMVLAMAERNHVPTEQWTIGGYPSVQCDMCGQAWPCATRRVLRAIAEKAGPSRD